MNADDGSDFVYQHATRREALERLVHAHPKLFPQMPTRSWLPVGWFALVDRLCRDIARELGGEPAAVDKLGEQFGALEVTVLPVTAAQRVQHLIDAARAESLVSCEYCSLPGTLRRCGALKVVCASCEALLLARLEQVRRRQ